MPDRPCIPCGKKRPSAPRPVATTTALTGTTRRIGVQWSRVRHSAEKVVIVGSGPSLRGVDLRFPPCVDAIAVNGAGWKDPATGDWVLPEPPRFWFTVDASPANRTIMRNPREGTTYYAAVPDDYAQPQTLPRGYRDPADEHVIYLRRRWGKGPKFSPLGLSVDPTAINIGNSGFGALGLAMLMGVRKVALLGIDGGGRYAWGPGQTGNLDALPELFESAVPQLEAAGVRVVVGSPKSRVRCWPRMTPEEAIAWVARND